MTLIGCGSNSSNSNINGTWNATLMGGGNATVFSFGTAIQVNSAFKDNRPRETRERVSRNPSKEKKEARRS